MFFYCLPDLKFFKIGLGYNFVIILKLVYAWVVTLLLYHRLCAFDKSKPFKLAGKRTKSKNLKTTETLIWKICFRYVWRSDENVFFIKLLLKWHTNSLKWHEGDHKKTLLEHTKIYFCNSKLISTTVCLPVSFPQKIKTLYGPLLYACTILWRAPSSLLRPWRILFVYLKWFFLLLCVLI